MSSNTAINRQAFLETAAHISRDLVRDAIWAEDGSRCTWAGYSMEPVEGAFSTVIRSFGNDLYGGTSGIAFFLSAMYSLQPEPLLKKTIEGAIQHVLSLLPATAPFGFYSGKAGVAVALVYSGEILERKEWIEQGLDLLQSLKEEEVQEFDIDIISGVAGTIPCLLSIGTKYKRDELLKIAVRLGHVLCDRAVRAQQASSWVTMQNPRNLTGYSHGTAGIGCSLLKLYSQTKEQRFLDTALEAFAYEQLHYQAAQQNWPDFRSNFTQAGTEQFNCGMAWCHGAPGIALSRLEALRYKNEASFRTVADIALATTRRDLQQMLTQPAYPGNYSLCHGMAGNADILLESGLAEDRQLAETIGLKGIEQFGLSRLPWPSGSAEAKPTPGLMMGLAGTGYFYLRLYDAQRFKTILLPQL